MRSAVKTRFSQRITCAPARPGNIAASIKAATANVRVDALIQSSRVLLCILKTHKRCVSCARSPRATSPWLGPRSWAGGNTLVEIATDVADQRVDLVVEEMVGAGDDPLVDNDPLLRLELFDQRVDVLLRRDRILVAMDDQARGRARREEREVIEVRLRRDRDEALDFRPTPRKLKRMTAKLRCANV